MVQTPDIPIGGRRITPVVSHIINSLFAVIKNPRQLTDGDVIRLINKSTLPTSVKIYLINHYNFEDTDSGYDSDETIAEDG